MKLPIITEKITNIEKLIEKYHIPYQSIRAEELLSYLSEPAPSGDKTTLEDILNSKWLLLHELIELSEIKRRGFVISPSLLYEENIMINKAHQTAFEWEMKVAFQEGDYQWVKWRILFVDSWIKHDEGLTEDEIDKYKNLKKHYEILVQVEETLETLKAKFHQELDNRSSTIRAIYLISSYARGDFVPGRSDIDFGVFLDLPEGEKHWKHPDFIKIEKIIRESFEALPKDWFRRDSTLLGVDVVSFATSELEQVKNDQIGELVGPLKNLTFFAFDLMNNKRLLWGEDVLKTLTPIPKPEKYAKQRMDWMRKQFFKKGNERTVSDLLVSLGSVIRHLAVLDGIRDLRKDRLKQWATQHAKWPSQVDYQTVISKYFEYITNNKLEVDYLDQYWQNETEKLITLMLNE